MTDETKEIIEKRDRVHNYFMIMEGDAVAYMAYALVAGKSVEYASTVLNTPLV